ncbi:TetR/AcrR family transcriptional regulator C-terminal domain-containing protein [Amycolatopsis regifaucium]|uniref:TetR family transcriptional regulator n=1 Tax=Amycolatopsis regifaucium TaxID=546365 RepID=A0A154MH33_9PSEU|nr:TetR/AcrR family transcriptional regulator C-terminal domain-containing protein [Amycolatopsis regifaucium]KZB83788.1 TetR family transcriptional regulator [Amycolatopsis regifaucium]OKA06771.1 TetR family transcriptional regulator [Amycolatopsis regifaucium]SFH26416.1 regulatory protein, tetR family [Amycolatopsis regifaucium]
MVVYAAQGDPRKSMALLWRTEQADAERPGPKPALSVDLIVDAAIAIADAEGMTGLSMRAVGDRLGRTAMALYTYVPSKSELLDLMYDKALAELPTSHDGADWRADATRWAYDLWDFYLRHPWVLQVSQARPVLGPHEYVVLESLVKILRRTGLPPVVLRRLISALYSCVREPARTAAESRSAEKVTGQTDDEWWYARSALLQEVSPDFAERFPTLTWMESEQAFRMEDETVSYLEQEAREAFEISLAVLLDGIEVAMKAE